MGAPINYIHFTKGDISVKDLSKFSYTCERNLLRLFNQYVGLSRKQYIRMTRFNFFFKKLIENPGILIEEIAGKYF